MNFLTVPETPKDFTFQRSPFLFYNKLTVKNDAVSILSKKLEKGLFYTCKTIRIKKSIPKANLVMNIKRASDTKLYQNKFLRSELIGQYSYPLQENLNSIILDFPLIWGDVFQIEYKTDIQVDVETLVYFHTMPALEVDAWGYNMNTTTGVLS